MASAVIVVLAEGFEEAEAVTTIDILRRGGVDVKVLGLSDIDVVGAHEILVRADGLLAEFTGECDGIVLPGGMPGTSHLADSQLVLDTVRRFNEQGHLCAAICAAPSVLAKAGILKGRRATCYPRFEGRLGGAIVTSDPVVVDLNIITSRGVDTSIPFALAIVEYLTGQENARSVAQKILHS